MNRTKEILWEEPNVEDKDLFYGSGGKAGQPDPTSSYIDGEIVLEDEAGRSWLCVTGNEAKADIAASRIVWAAGYFVDQNYFVERAHVKSRDGYDLHNVRLKYRKTDYNTRTNWSWSSNPFFRSKELEGLKVIMALLTNWRPDDKNNLTMRDGINTIIYYVADLKATLGKSGICCTRSIGNADDFSREPFIDRRKSHPEEVRFHYNWVQPNLLRGISSKHARWVGDLLSRLSREQLGDAFRAGGFNERESKLFVEEMEKRIKTLQELR
jgi:hypothetical protein